MSNAGKTTSNAISAAATGALSLRQALFQDQDAYGIIVTDGNGVITDWNAAAERMYGYSRDEALGQPLDFIRVPADGSTPSDAIAAGLVRDGSWTGAVNFTRKDGSVGVSNTVFLGIVCIFITPEVPYWILLTILNL